MEGDLFKRVGKGGLDKEGGELLEKINIIIIIIIKTTLFKEGNTQQ